MLQALSLCSATSELLTGNLYAVPLIFVATCPERSKAVYLVFSFWGNAMKVVLVVPPMPYSLSDAPDLQFPPLALCYLGAVVRECEHDVTLIDMTVSEMTIDDLRSRLVKIQPDVVGISCLSASYPKGTMIAALAKQVLPEPTVIMGGMHPTFTDRETIERYPVDIVVRNEGEITIRELLAQLGTGADGLGRVPGITYKDPDNIVRRNPDRDFINALDELPQPAYDLLDTMPTYRKLDVFLVITTRGCPYHCIFCSSSPFWGHHWRTRSISHVMKEIDLLVSTYGAKQIVFGDDNFALNKKRILDLCDALSGRGYDIDWRCSVRADSLTKPLLMAMRKSGCSAVFIGVESGSQASLDLLQKRESVEQSVRAVKWCREVGIETTCAMLMGLPWETEEDIRNNIRFVSSELKPDEVVWNLLHPDPGSEIFERMEKHGLRFAIRDPERHIGNAPSVIETANLSAEQLNQLWMEACLKSGVGEEL